MRPARSPRRPAIHERVRSPSFDPHWIFHIAKLPARLRIVKFLVLCSVIRNSNRYEPFGLFSSASRCFSESEGEIILIMKVSVKGVRLFFDDRLAETGARFVNRQ